jgi:hypothetical protein
MSIVKNARVLFAVFGFALAIPTALTIAANVAQASGYMVASGFDLVPHCTPGGGDDCPEGGIIDDGSR